MAGAGSDTQRWELGRALRRLQPATLDRRRLPLAAVLAVLLTGIALVVRTRRRPRRASVLSRPSPGTLPATRSALLPAPLPAPTEQPASSATSAQTVAPAAAVGAGPVEAPDHVSYDVVVTSLPGSTRAIPRRTDPRPAQPRPSRRSTRRASLAAGLLTLCAAVDS